jgi:hypothetical protein
VGKDLVFQYCLGLLALLGHHQDLLVLLRALVDRFQVPLDISPGSGSFDAHLQTQEGQSLLEAWSAGELPPEGHLMDVDGQVGEESHLVERHVVSFPLVVPLAAGL